MSKQFYEEALADFRQVRKVAEDSVRSSLIEAVTPRIRELIESAILDEADEQACDADTDGDGEPDAKDVIIDDVATDQSVMEVSDGVVEGLANIADPVKASLAEAIARAKEQVASYEGASVKLRSTTVFQEHISKMIADVEDMYEYVQGAIVNSDEKHVFENDLETLNQGLNSLQESMMSKKSLNEEDVTLKLTGLPDDLDLDTLGVDLISGDEEGDIDGDDLAGGEEGDDLDLDMGGDEGDMGEEAPAGDLDLEEEDMELENVEGLSDDTVVEIDENFLRTEIARMRKIREEKMGTNVIDDFGAGHAEGDAFLDGEVTTVDNEGEADAGGSKTVAVACESSSVAFEARLKARAEARLVATNKKLAEARKANKAGLVTALTSTKNALVKRINECTARITKLKGPASEQASLNEASSNAASKTQAEKSGSNGEKKLRERLAESNLENVKLAYTNKLLQIDTLTSRQKGQIIDRLAETKTSREAKLVYESLTQALSSKRITENTDRSAPVGSSSRVSRTSAPTLTEGKEGGIEMARWARIAGIKD